MLLRSNKSGRWNASKVYCLLFFFCFKSLLFSVFFFLFQKFTVYCFLSTVVKTQLSIKLSKKNFGGILRNTECPKSVRRTLVMGLIYGPRANKQFDFSWALIQLALYCRNTHI